MQKQRSIDESLLLVSSSRPNGSCSSSENATTTENLCQDMISFKVKPSYFVLPSFFKVIGKSSVKGNYIFSCEKCFSKQISRSYKSQAS